MNLLRLSLIPRRHAFRFGLGFKLLILVVGASLIGVLTSSFLVLTLQRQQIEDNALSATTHLSNGIQSSLEFAMLRNDRVMIDQIVQTMVNKRNVEHIRILDSRGIVQVSSEAWEVGDQFDYSQPTCQFCHTDQTRPANRTIIYSGKDNHEALLNINLIYNQPNCWTCHAPQTRVLGLLMIETPLRNLNDQLTAAFWRITLSALATLGLLVGLMILALKKLVFQPVGALTNGMTAVQSGNLDATLVVPSRDELGDLAETFNAMRQQLKTSHVKNDLLLAETRRREQETNALHRLMIKISSSLETPQVLDAIAEGAQQILGTDIGVVALTDETQTEIQARACSGTRSDILKRIALPVRELFAGAVSTEPLCIEEWGYDLPIPHIAELIVEEGIVSSLAAPMWHGGRLYGYVATMTRQPRHFTKQDTQLLTQLALQVVIAIVNAELYRKVRYVSILEERDRLAREMHDNLAQMLGYLNIKTALTDDLLAKEQITQARSSLLELKKITKEAYTDVREAIFNLRSPLSSGCGLIPQLTDYLTEYRTHYGIDAQLIVEDARFVEFPEEVEVQVNRIIQEALTNVRKHSGASKAWVRFQQNDHHVTIRIEDNGRGFDLARSRHNGSEHFGLQIMRERAASVGGEFDVDSQPGLGTRIKLELATFPQFEDPHEDTRCFTSG